MTTNGKQAMLGEHDSTAQVGCAAAGASTRRGGFVSQLARENPDVTVEQLEDLAAVALLTAPAPDGVYVGRACHGCGWAEIRVRADRAHLNSKWYALCPACLAWEV